MHTARFALGEKPGISPANRSLARGVEILRAFRPGSERLGNAELAERTGLSRATVSRLTQTLVGVGMLERDARWRAYRLAPAVLSVAHAMRAGSSVLQHAAPHMRALAEHRRINVGLAAPDRDEMVYLESVRYSRRAALRSVVSGQRVPMERTSLGRAYLAVAPAARRRILLSLFKQRRGAQWPALNKEIDLAREHVARFGYCHASWLPEVVAVSTPLIVGDAIYALNLSVSSDAAPAAVARELHAPLLTLRDTILHALAQDDAP